VTFLCEPGFGTWQAFDVRTNSSMLLLAPDFSSASAAFFGFDENQQQQVLNALSQFDTST